jgi:hypothetical protein
VREPFAVDREIVIDLERREILSILREVQDLTDDPPTFENLETFRLS